MATVEEKLDSIIEAQKTPVVATVDTAALAALLQPFTDALTKLQASVDALQATIGKDASAS